MNSVKFARRLRGGSLPRSFYTAINENGHTHDSLSFRPCFDANLPARCSGARTLPVGGPRLFSRARPDSSSRLSQRVVLVSLLLSIFSFRSFRENLNSDTSLSKCDILLQMLKMLKKFKKDRQALSDRSQICFPFNYNGQYSYSFNTHLI